MKLAQLNIARAKYPIDSPGLEGFVRRIDAVNEVAERSPGFVWRLKDDAGSALEIQWFDDPYLLVNMSVWDDVESLKSFVFKTVHARVMAHKDEWFKVMESNHVVLWWIEDGHIPTEAEAKEKLELLDNKGPTVEAFHFGQLFNADGEATVSE